MKRPESTSARRSYEEFRALSDRILDFGNRDVSRVDFLREILKLFGEFAGCDSAELWLRENHNYIHCSSSQVEDHSFQYEVLDGTSSEDGRLIPVSEEESPLNQLRIDIIRGHYDASEACFTDKGSFWTGEDDKHLSADAKIRIQRQERQDEIEAGFRSLALIPIIIEDERLGLLQLAGEKRGLFERAEIKYYEESVHSLGIALASQRAQAALRERVKELTCLYSISQVTERQGISLADILKGIADLLPPAWQYPEITAGRIVLDGQIYSTPGFQVEGQRQSADIAVRGNRRGSVEVVYFEKMPDLDEGPFLREERNLIDAIARQVALIVERREAENERSKLQEQLRHADRLATLGQLAAGVAHELNEPLGSILGFAQLLNKTPDLPEQAKGDVRKIEEASLHAREVVKKLMLFGRQMPPQKARISLNDLVREGLYFLKSRCRKSGIKVSLKLEPGLPEISADQSQIYQVLVNLAVNAVQAMPDGGRLTIITASKGSRVSLTVEDTGVGMNEETKKKIFLPFFTTKEIGEGTGIGLSVVHGIVTSHGGTISAESRLGKGSRFEVLLPVENSKKGAAER